MRDCTIDNSGESRCSECGNPDCGGNCHSNATKYTTPSRKRIALLEFLANGDGEYVPYNLCEEVNPAIDDGHVRFKKDDDVGAVVVITKSGRAALVKAGAR